MHLQKKRLEAFIPAIIWMGLIAYLSASSISLPKVGIEISDKLGHFVFYGIFTFIVIWGVKKYEHQISNKSIFFSALFCIMYGVLMEYMQYAFFPNRYFEYNDMLANTGGVLITVILTIFINKIL